MQIPGAERPQQVAVSLLREGPWASLPTDTVELLAAGGSLSDVLAGVTVYTEADAERFAVVVVVTCATPVFGALAPNCGSKSRCLSHSICQSAEAPTVTARGWVPAHAGSGEPTVWFFSRGC